MGAWAKNIYLKLAPNSRLIKTILNIKQLYKTFMKKYPASDLAMFKKIIDDKLSKSLEELRLLKETTTGKDTNGTDDTSWKFSPDDCPQYASKEEATIMAHKQELFIVGLRNALIRIQQGTYGVCSISGELIDRNRLLAVPHTMYNINAKKSIQPNTNTEEI